jgi:hypothetical protein
MLNNEIEERLTIVVESVEGTDKNTIVSAIKHLDLLVENRADEMDDRLIHFLQRRSYQKALEFLRDLAEAP